VTPAAQPGGVELTLAISDYDHVRDLASGAVAVDGVRLNCLQLPVEEIFYRFTRFREWELSELSFAKYCSLRAAGDESLVAIPVFPSRSFRHSAFYVSRDGPVDRPDALKGARIGIPEWTVTATVYGRALLQHEYGVDIRNVQWVQGGTNEPGRVETLPVDLPDGVAMERATDRSLNDMLLAGEIEALLAPHPPAAFTDGSGRVVHLFSDCQAEEEKYYRRTRVFPIMHVVTIREDVYRLYPWLAMNLLKAFEEAKRRSQARALDINAPCYPVPWAPAQAHRAADLFGADFWPYGLEANLTTIEAFLEWAVEQGICSEKISPESLFARETLASFKV
jgi:4,5-dihydroxyphthalate decarboxylase